MPSSADADDQLSTALSNGVDRVHAAARAVDTRPVVVLIDGRSGAGKTTFARRLAARWEAGADVAVLKLDDIYPGWDGLQAGAATAAEVIRAVRGGAVGRWRAWDWDGDTASARLCGVAARDVLIVEGAGLLTATSIPLADVTVWLEAPEPSRRARALHRDGDAYRPHWERWSAQESEHLRRDDPRSRADIVIDLP
ncbi:zeta toxin family protein [Microbacterium sp. 179-B 1A2 NHS]|uniref:zeta toxin family protein n=1 Tax=Microbacterium sp. 179-B 1A2 NHS TaxID=3142383 RepID=UPI0039A0D191